MDKPVNLLKPPGDWPYVNRRFPEGAELKVVNIHPKWIDLLWVDPVRNVEVYLSTKPNPALPV